jgi:hypothetical protein
MVTRVSCATPSLVKGDGTKTDVIFVRSRRSEEPLPRALEDMRHVSSDLRKIGLGLQADRLDQIAIELSRPPTFPGILADIGAPHTWVTSAYARYLAELLTSGAEIIRALMADAEITGSTDALRRAHVWLKALQIDDGVERES